VDATPGGGPITRRRIALCITKAERGGAQSHVALLLEHLAAAPDLEPLLFVGSPGPLIAVAERLGVHVTVQPGLAGDLLRGKSVATLRSLRTLRTTMRNADLDLVHGHSSVAGAVVRIVGASIGVPVLFTAHGWAFTERAPAFRRLVSIIVEWLLGRITSACIAVSMYDYRLARRFRTIPRERLHIVRNGLPATAHSEVDVTKAPGCRIVMTARFAPPKRQVDLLRALEHVPGNWSCELIGSGPELADAQREAQLLGLADVVEFPGECDDVPERLRAADVFVLLSDYEGLPVSVIEAMRESLPVVASDVGGIGELVTHGRNGLLVPHRDEHALVDALTTLVRDSDLRVELGAEGRRRFLNEFTADHMVQQTFQIYRAVLSARVRRRRSGSFVRGCADRA
jgi:glycosyltransferase involved in cell wall biosynthesis